MNLEELKDKTILLFGKSRAFSEDEFLAQMKFHRINVVKEFSEDVVLIVDGKMMTPYEQIESDKLYEEHKEVEFIAIDALESAIASKIDSDTLLMSLKLSGDKMRLKSFLQNRAIPDALFLKLLKMYKWGAEGFFENDSNRDVTAAIIVRFYKNIEQNHNVQYATLGLMHLVVQTKSSELLESVFFLEPLQKSLKKSVRDENFNILSSIATHAHTPKNVVLRFVHNSSAIFLPFIAMRKDNDEAIQKSLYETHDASVLETLSYNEKLNRTIADTMLQEGIYVKNIARFIELDEDLFQRLLLLDKEHLAQNESLTKEMQNTLVKLHSEDVNLALALNHALVQEVAVELITEDNSDIHLAIYANSATPVQTLEEAYEDAQNHISLAYNENTPQHILKLLALSDDVRVLEGVAKNHATPVDVLYQLQLDKRVERYVKENPVFGENIKTQNIGWNS